MIKVKHPDEKYRKNQEEFLDSCLPEDRRFHALMFTYGYMLLPEEKVLIIKWQPYIGK